MSFTDAIILFVAGWLAGTVNAVAGGGTFITFSALVLTGLPTIEANATSAVSLAPASLASAGAYHREMRLYARELIAPSVIGVIGGVIGGWLLIHLGDKGFRPMVPWLLGTATLIFALSGKLREWIAPIMHAKGMLVRITAFAVMGLVSIYGGFFGAGMGIVLLAVLMVLEAGQFHKANMIKNFISTPIALGGIALLIYGGLVHWPQALVTTTSATLAGYFGIGLARRVTERVLRAIIIAFGAALTALFFVRG